MKQNYVVISAIVLMVSVFALGAYLFSSQQTKSQNQRVSQNSAALIKFHSHRAGNPSAKVTIVEFLDPACETCRAFHPLVKQLLAQHEGKINLVIRYAPFHQGSNQMVKILEAAKKQNKFCFKNTKS